MQNGPLAQTHRRLKRKPGGQKGNQNARKHGFYSRALSPDEIGEFWNIVNLERVDPEVALVRLKLKSLLQHDPVNRRVLRTASGLLAKWYRAKYGLGRPDGNDLKAVIRSILAQLPGASPSEPLGPPATPLILTKRIERTLTIESGAVNCLTHEKGHSNQEPLLLQNKTTTLQP